MTPTSLSELGALAIGGVSLPMLLAKATIILIVALGVTLSMQRASAGSRHLVWLVTLGTLLLVPALTAWAPLRLAILPAAPVATTYDVSPSLGTADKTQSLTSAPSDRRPTAPAGAAEAPASTSTGLVARVQGMSPIALLLAVWTLVMLAIGISLAWAGLTVRRIVKEARPLDAPGWLTPLWEVSDRLGLEEAPRLLQSDEAKMPFACGILAPTIVLPTECESWSLDRRHAVLLHELAHVRRHDLFGHTLGRLVCAVYWFHPLVWTAAKQLRSESERACDDLALACGTRATDYAEHLLDIVTSVRRDSTPAVALAMARRKEFEGRMLAILDPELRHSSPSRRQSAALITSLALIAVVVGAAAPAPREANAAALYVPKEERSWTAEPKIAAMPQTQPQAQQRAKSYPDSGERGVIRKSTQTATQMATQTSAQMAPQMHESIDAQVSTTTSSAISNSAAAFGAAVGRTAGSAASEAIRQLLAGGSKQSARKDSDERPVLLAKILRTDSSTALRRIAAWGLSEYAGEQVAADALAAALKRDTNGGVREMAAWALGESGEGHAAASDALRSALRSDADEKVRMTAAWAIGSSGDHSSVDALTAALADPSERVRLRAAWAIGNVGPKQAPKPLIALLGDKDPHTRQLAAWALYQIEDPAAIPALQAAMKNETDRDLQIDYIRALAALGERSVDALRGLLESPDPKIKSIAVRALAGGHATGPWPWPWPEPRPYP
jgi:beta-lactamase regulating signal transducer with metallopeptidase domain/HEAT repeat protein